MWIKDYRRNRLLVSLRVITASSQAQGALGWLCSMDGFSFRFKEQVQQGSRWKRGGLSSEPDMHLRTDCRMWSSILTCTELNSWYYLPKWLLWHLHICNFTSSTLSYLLRSKLRLILDILIFFLIYHPLAKPTGSSYHFYNLPLIHATTIICLSYSSVFLHGLPELILVQLLFIRTFC